MFFKSILGSREILANNVFCDFSFMFRLCEVFFTNVSLHYASGNVFAACLLYWVNRVIWFGFDDIKRRRLIWHLSQSSIRPYIRHYIYFSSIVKSRSSPFLKLSNIERQCAKLHQKIVPFLKQVYMNESSQIPNVIDRCCSVSTRILCFRCKEKPTRCTFKV